MSNIIEFESPTSGTYKLSDKLVNPTSDTRTHSNGVDQFVIVSDTNTVQLRNIQTGALVDESEVIIAGVYTDIVLEYSPDRSLIYAMYEGGFKVLNAITLATISTNILSPAAPSYPVDWKAMWKLNGNTNDETGKYDMVNHGATSVAGRSGNPDTAYEFVASENDYMDYDGVVTQSNKGCVLARVKWANNGLNSIIYMQTEKTSLDNWVYVRINADGKLKLNYREGSSDFSIETVNSITENVWTDIYIDSDSTSYYIYFDNVLQNFTGANNGLWFDRASTVDNSIIGRFFRAISNNAFFSGTIDFVTIFERTLTSQERIDFANSEV